MITTQGRCCVFLQLAQAHTELGPKRHALGRELKRIYMNQTAFASWRALRALLRLVRILQQTNVPAPSHPGVLALLCLLGDKGSQSPRGSSLSYFLWRLFSHCCSVLLLPFLPALCPAVQHRLLRAPRSLWHRCGVSPAVSPPCRCHSSVTCRPSHHQPPSGCSKPQLRPQP